jgi:2-isopropylmalate synthase
LKITPEENLKKIFESVRFLKNHGLKVFYDAEHFFDGFKENKDYAISSLLSALDGGAERIVLCDTNGGILPEEAREILKECVIELEKHEIDFKLGVHFHDDSGLALANTIASLPYIVQVQGTINGTGERLGNLNFSEFLPVYVSKMNNELDIDLTMLKEVSEAAFRHAGINIPEKRAFVGDTAFSHKAGVHIDATKKGASYEHAIPEDFGNKRTILLNSLGGKSSVMSVAEQFGYSIDKDNLVVKEKIKQLMDELKEMEKIGYRNGSIRAEQLLLIKKYFDNFKVDLKIKEWEIRSDYRDGKETSYFKALCIVDGEEIEGSLTIFGGPVDCAFKTIKNILLEKYPEIADLHIFDFHVSIARQKQEESSVRTRIDFRDGKIFSCVGVDKNILGSAIEAIEKGFRYYLNQENGGENESC